MLHAAAHRRPALACLALCFALCFHTGCCVSGSRVGWGRRRGERAPPPAPPLPGFTEDVANQTVVVGRDATLRCSVEHLGKYKIAWMKHDTQTLLSISATMISRNYRIKVTHSDNSTWFLHLRAVTLEDRGYYLCQINTVPPVSRMGYLEVVVPPNIVDEETSEDEDVAEDSPVTLRCAAEGYPAPEVTFKREDERPIRFAAQGIAGARAQSVTESAGGLLQTRGSLTFQRVSRLDMGIYLCIAINAVPPSVSKRLVLNVRYREPEVVVNQQLIGVYRGDNVAINCTATAYPRPVVFWQDETGKMIISGGKYEVEEWELGSRPPRLLTRLLIRNVQLEDMMTYSCNASIDNDKNKEKSTEVQINEIPRPSTESSFQDTNYIKGDRRPKQTQKSLSKPIRINDIGDRHEKPTKFTIPDIFLPPGRASYDEATRATSAASQRPLPLPFMPLLLLLLYVPLLPLFHAAATPT